MVNTCSNCDKELIIKQKTKPAKYCSDACRKAFKRKNKDNAENGQKTDKKNALQSNMARDNGQTYAKLPEITDKITDKVIDSGQDIAEITDTKENGQIDNGQIPDNIINNGQPWRNEMEMDYTIPQITPAIKPEPAAIIPLCPRGINPNVWAMQQELKAGYQYKGRNKTMTRLN